MFAARPAEWVLIGLCAFALLAFTTLLVPIPLIGPILPPLLLALLMGGMFFAAARQASGEEPRFEHVFSGFRLHPGNLTLVGLFYAIPLILIYLLTMLALGGSLVASLLGWSLGSTINLFATSLLSMLAGLGVALGVFLMLWGIMLLALMFSPALIMLNQAPPLDAMRLSLTASLRNLGGIVLLSIMLYILFVIALIPAGLGVLIYIPLVVGSLHAAYLELFEAPTAAGLATTAVPETP